MNTNKSTISREETESRRSPLSMNDSETNGGQSDGVTSESATGSRAPLHSEYEETALPSSPFQYGKEARTLQSSQTTSNNGQRSLRTKVKRRASSTRPMIDSASFETSHSDEDLVSDQSSSSTSDGTENDLSFASFHPSLDQQHRRLSLSPLAGDQGSNSVVRDTTPATIGHAILKQKQRPESKKRTLVVYSGPTSLDGTIGKNDIYLANFEYFIQHGIECHGLGGTDIDPESQPFEDLNLQYVIVLTQDVADKYTAEDGLITKKQAECRAAQQDRQRMNKQVLGNDSSLITVLVREDRCYDMESLLLVSRTYDIPHLYDHMVYINCGLAGPKFGTGSPEHWEHLSSWTELYTSLLSDKVQMVGHTINTHFNTVYSPHVQSFLFAINTPMIDIWLQTGAIYECGMSNEDFRDDLVKMALVWRYEVGISRVLLERGYSIAAAFMHQQGRLGVPLIIDNNSTFGRHFDKEDIIHSDVFLEEGVRRLTESSFPEYVDHTKYAILPWDCYVFFKVSRLVPSDIQEIMQYEHLGPVELVPNDARSSTMRKWRRKAGVSILGDLSKILPGVSYQTGALRCYGRHCQFDEVATATGELVCVFMFIVFAMWYVATAKVVEKRLSLARLKQRKWM